MVKTFKILLLQNRECLQAESWHKSSKTEGLPKLLKWWSYNDVWPFYGEVKFASVCICLGLIDLYGKNVDNFKWLLLWSLWANFAQISCGASGHLSFKTRSHECRVQCSMPVRLGHWQNQTSNVCSGMTGQWSDRSVSGCKTSQPGPVSYLRGLALRIWTSFWRREGSTGMDMWNALMVQSRQPFTYRLRESVGGPGWHESSWQRGIAESGSSRLPALMIKICGDLVWYLPCVQQASYLEGGPLMWMLPLYLHVNQKSNYDYDTIMSLLGAGERKKWSWSLDQNGCHAHIW